MSLAELHGKTSPQEESAEDILTSEVFEGLDVIGQNTLLRWLGLAAAIKAEGTLGPRLATKFPLVPGDVSCRLWSWFPSVMPGVPGCEPDVIIQIGRLLLLVEMKYLSGLSGEGINRSPGGGGSRLDDQLGRQWFAGYAARHLKLQPTGNPIEPFDDWAVVFVTQHWNPPAAEFSSSIDAVSKWADDALKAGGPRYTTNDVRSRLYWINYQVLHELLGGDASAGECAHSARARLRLRSLLERKGFRSFEGILPRSGGALHAHWAALQFTLEDVFKWPASRDASYHGLEWGRRFEWPAAPAISVDAGAFYCGGSNGA